MILSTIVKLSDKVQSIVDEHGSSKVLRDHLLLFKDQAIVLEKKNVALTCENTVLIKENTSLSTKVINLESEINDLRKYKENIINPANYKFKYGCLVFDDDDSLYCNICFVNNGNKSQTIRLSSKERQCLVCEETIPSGWLPHNKAFKRTAKSRLACYN